MARRTFFNIEKSPCPKGIWKYIGYGHRSVYYVGRVGGLRPWAATRRTGDGPSFFSAHTLEELSQQLASERL